MYQIKSSLDQDCPTLEQTCVTLSNFSTTFPTNDNDNESISLLFLPGNHTLESHLTFINHRSVTMVKSNATMVSQPVIITCNNDAKFEFIELNSLLVVSLTFVGCTETKVESVHAFTLKDSIFKGQNVGTALKLDRVAASVVGSSFSSYGGESIGYFVTCYDIFGLTSYHATLRVGGAIIANHSRLVIDKSDFQYNMADIGGVIYSVHESNLSITNSNFTNNRANLNYNWYSCYCGGGVLQSDNSSSVYISNSQFKSNSASTSGGVVSVVDNKGVNSDTSINVVHNSTFTDNSAGQGGGVVSVYSGYTSNSNMTLTITDCDIMNNNADWYGGAVAVFSRHSTHVDIIITVTDSNFTNNTASEGGVFYLSMNYILYEQAVYLPSVTTTLAIAHSKFIHNMANRYGGGVISVSMFSIIQSMVTVTVVVNISDHSIFSDNNGLSGGVIRAHESSPGLSLSVHIADSEIKHNKADNGGGVVSIEAYSSGFSANLVFAGCKVIGNQANHGSVVNIQFEGNYFFRSNVTQSEFCNNIATNDGGVLYLVRKNNVRGDNVEIIDSKFIGNRGGNRGGVAYTSSVEHFTVIDSQFFLNNAGQGGGVIASVSKGTINMTRCSFTHNTGGRGGVLNTQSGHLFLDLTKFASNVATSGGVIHSKDSTNNFSGTIFDNNRADNNGGAILIDGGSTLIKNTTFVNNSAGSDGGVVHSHSSYLTLELTNFTKNVATSGGVLWIEDATATNFLLSVFDGNLAEVDGGVIYSQRSNTNFSETIFDNNRADNNGGAIFIDEGSTLFKNTTFFNNSAGSDGGVVRLLRGYLNLELTNFTSNVATSGGVLWIEDATATNFLSSVFDGNLAKVDGGVIYSISSTSNFKETIFDDNRANNNGGTMFIDGGSILISKTTFFNNSAGNDGGAMHLHSGYFTIELTNFTSNVATSGGVLWIEDATATNCLSTVFDGNLAKVDGGVIYSISSTSNFKETVFDNNRADNNGGTMFVDGGYIFINKTTFFNNSAGKDGGAMHVHSGYFTIEVTNFTSNVATSGGVLWIEDATATNFLLSVFDGNLAEVDGGVIYSQRSNTNFSETIFDNNRAENNGGTMFLDGGSTFIKNSTFFNNSAGNDGGVIDSYLMDSASIEQCKFTSNEAKYDGGVIHADQCVTKITETFFEGNKANAGGVLRIEQGSTSLVKSSLIHNEASAGGVIWAKRASMSSKHLNVTHNYGNFCVMQLISSEYMLSDIIYLNNTGSVFAQDSSVHIDGDSTFKLTNNVQPHRLSHDINRMFEGGAVTAFQSAIFLRGVCVFQNNSAIKGGALNVIQSNVEVHGQITLIDNRATEAGGGIHLCHSELICKDNSALKLQRNTGSEKGGGIMAFSSNIKVKVDASSKVLIFEDNHASKGGGLYFEISSSLVILKSDANTTHSEIVTFHNNSASYGGAIYVSDDGMCSLTTLDDCPFQALAMYSPMLVEDDITDTRCKNVLRFNDNMATFSGEDLFGGLLDRCKVSMFAEPNVNNVNMDYSFSNGTMITNGYEYLVSISNIVDEHVSSEPIRVCFCREGSGQPDCDYQPPSIVVKKGQQRNISLSVSVVDQIHKPLNETIIISQFESGNYLCQNHIQNTYRNCQEIDFAVESDNATEVLIISVGEGPCKDTEKSQARVTLNYQCNNCPIGFEIDEIIDSCHCDCDSQLWPHFTNCSGYLLVRDSNVWVSYINESEDSSHYQYLIHPYCPYNYCHDLDAMVKINLSQPNGADAQCVNNRTGLICGRCARGFSLSVGSSRCVKCPKLWPLITVGIIVGSIIGGIALVALLLILNLTVATGTLNGIILYANIVSSNSSTFFPPTVSKFITFFISWLNLEAGFDSCFFEGLDAYWKTFLQLVFPSYIIFLVAVVIIVSEHSPRFAKMIGKRNPVATLATLILFSYTKLLGSIISSLSFTVLNYPYDTRQLVWLPDASVSFLSGKHICLFIFALLILLTGLVYTMLLVFWQLFLRLPDKRVFSWIRYQKLCHFIEPYHAPYNFEHRYWTGLLLLVRVIVYIVTAANVSGTPQLPLLVINITVGSLLLLKGLLSSRVYKKWPTDIIETMMYFNIVSFAALTSYNHNTASIQETIAHISVTFTFILFLVVIFYHVYKYTCLHSLIEKKRVLELVKAKVLRKEVEQPAEENPQPANHDNKPHKVTFTEIELSNRHVI